MVDRTFTAAVDSDASNPDNWSPTGTPESGDNLKWVVGGTMDVSGNALNGDTLVIGSPINPAPPEDFVINVNGKAQFTEAAAFPPVGIGKITINLADHSKWIGGFSSNLAGGVFITGDGKFDNETSLSAASSVVDAKVVGHGTFRVSSAQSVPGALEFTKSVGRGQAVTVAGDPGRDVHATLTVDDPHDYHASNTLGFGEITLAGLKADSFSIKHDVLLLFSGSKVVDRLRLTVDTQIGAKNFGVSQTDAGIVVHADNFNENGSTPLSMHS